MKSVQQKNVPSTNGAPRPRGESALILDDVIDDLSLLCMAMANTEASPSLEFLDGHLARVIERVQQAKDGPRPRGGVLMPRPLTPSDVLGTCPEGGGLSRLLDEIAALSAAALEMQIHGADDVVHETLLHMLTRKAAVAARLGSGDLYFHEDEPEATPAEEARQ